MSFSACLRVSFSNSDHLKRRDLWGLAELWKTCETEETQTSPRRYSLSYIYIYTVCDGDSTRENGAIEMFGMNNLGEGQNLQSSSTNLSVLMPSVVLYFGVVQKSYVLQDLRAAVRSSQAGSGDQSKPR